MFVVLLEVFSAKGVVWFERRGADWDSAVLDPATLSHVPQGLPTPGPDRFNATTAHDPHISDTFGPPVDRLYRPQDAWFDPGDAVYALFHARPEYLAHHMRDWDKWNRVPKRSDHPCVSYAGGELTPTDMPSLDDFALWAKARWDQSMAVSNGVVLLLHYMRFTNGGTLARLRDHDYKYWKTLCMIGRLRTGI